MDVQNSRNILFGDLTANGSSAASLVDEFAFEKVNFDGAHDIFKHPWGGTRLNI
jgi:hypothetical protein